MNTNNQKPSLPDVAMPRDLMQRCLSAMKHAVSFGETGKGRPPSQTCMFEIEELESLLAAQPAEGSALVASEQEAELFADFVERQFHQQGRPVRCRACPGICWEDGMVAKHWITWQAARSSTIPAAEGATQAGDLTDLDKFNNVWNDALEEAALICDQQAQEHECPERASYCADEIRALKHPGGDKQGAQGGGNASR